MDDDDYISTDYVWPSENDRPDFFYSTDPDDEDDFENFEDDEIIG